MQTARPMSVFDIGCLFIESSDTRLGLKFSMAKSVAKYMRPCDVINQHVTS